ncbi:MAG TPA: glutamate-5-semialdehyde dehydrogenase [Aquifex aeolicus]|uniref:Gamma-glutamyl phosphate reductase n=1 Tax=Aquifex aeolicus TaxID=63363 RepID=A0A9D1CF56_AQUAO|nr:glutamate-5-semialdehyde dehydrogenase [Aquificales bacterium]HIP86798.1 glutamate-5-semialdehyde dehydrogenase [Aquifex sp.]HIP98289.1 glutamate-5-semialdehyde dehydrogenase [Aquifex aeolicus]HIQ25866.1 glutamate-5-semialdehyde dehydrogenase [Aquifex aeolicus]
MAELEKELKEYLKGKVLKARSTLRELINITTEVKNRTLLRAAELIDRRREEIKEANRRDIETAKRMGLSKAVIDRLLLNDKRIDGMIKVLKDVANLEDPVGKIDKMWTRPDGLKIGKMRVPLGVILIIYESRPNVTVEAASLCIKTSNAIILRGGKEALNSNKILTEILKEAARETGFPQEAIQFIENPDRRLVWELLKMEGLIDVAIPRGGESLIRAVSENAKIPVIKHYKGVCTLFVDKYADLEKAYDIVFNAKVQRPSVCNAIENLLVHKDIAEEFLPKMAYFLAKAGVELRVDEGAMEILKSAKLPENAVVKAATEEDYYEEFLDLILAVKIVDNLGEAIAFIEKYGSKHSDGIISENYSNVKKFLETVDSAAVYANASTRFTDGNEFGLGAEMGISTDKIHVRGPMGLEDLTIPKYIILGEGHIRDNFGVPKEWKEEV